MSDEVKTKNHAELKNKQRGNQQQAYSMPIKQERQDTIQEAVYKVRFEQPAADKFVGKEKPVNETRKLVIEQLAEQQQVEIDSHAKIKKALLCTGCTQVAKDALFCRVNSSAEIKEHGKKWCRVTLMKMAYEFLCNKAMLKHVVFLIVKLIYWLSE